MKLFRYFTFFVFMVLFCSQAFAQDENTNQSKCDCKECHQFDFWLGSWNVEWENNDGTKGEGTNTVNSILNGCVIQENFKGNPGIAFEGKSFSVYNHTEKIWQQTWVDSQGGYMVFTGGFENSKMVLSRKINRDGKDLIQRMVFYNISPNSLDWNWELSSDNGNSWELKWKIHYTKHE